MTKTLNDEFLRVTAGDPAGWYRANGGTGTTFNDIEKSWLLSMLPPGPKNEFMTVSDLWLEFLDFAGYRQNGEALNDALLQFWSAQSPLA